MPRPAIHQFVPTLSARDAIGTHVRRLQRLLRRMGVASDIYVEGAPGARRREARPYRSYAASPDEGPTWLLYQLSTGSAVADFLLARPEPKIVNFHNITPPELFAPWGLDVGAELAWGRRQLHQLAPVTELAIAASAYSQGELQAAGYRRTVVAPVLVDVGGADGPIERDGRALATLRRAKHEGGADWLFVGRVAPNKCQHHLVRALAAYRRLYDEKARLYLVGATDVPGYARALTAYAEAVGVADAVHLTGSVSPAHLQAHYSVADVFVCLSDHEGFCVPIVEAMRRRLPVVAYATAAVPETVGDGGLLLSSKEAVTVAAAVHRVVTDAHLRAELMDRGRRRASELSIDRAEAAFERAIEPLLGDRV